MPADKQRRILEVLAKGEHLQLFPESAHEVRDAVDRDHGLDALQAVVERDPALSANLLKLANSPYFGRSKAVSSIRDAILLIGSRATRDMAMALAVLALAENSKLEGGRKQLDHAIRVSGTVQAALVEQGLGQSIAVQGMIAGLVHDLGRILLSQIYPSTYVPLLEQGDTVSGEHELLGFNHAEFTATCLRTWHLPDLVCDAVEHHHLTEVEITNRFGDSPLASLIRAIREADDDPLAAKDDETAAA